MPQVQISPPPRRGGFGNFARNLVGFLAAPVASVANNVVGVLTSASDRYLTTTLDTETGDEVTIGVDHRPLRGLIEAAEAEYEATGEPLVVEYEDWQVLRRTPAEEVTS